MTQTLFGIPVPADAVKVVIRPLFGKRGGAIPLFTGVCDEQLTETEILEAVSTYATFWRYVSARGILPDANGLYLWKLKVTFVNQSGVEEHHTTAEPVEVFCALSGDDGSASQQPVEDAISRLMAAGMQAIRDVGMAATQMINAGAAPLTRAIEAIERGQDRDLNLRQDLLESIAHLSNELRAQAAAQAPPAQEADPIDSLVRLGTLFVGVTKGLDYLRKRNEPN